MTLTPWNLTTVLDISQWSLISWYNLRLTILTWKIWMFAMVMVKILIIRPRVFINFDHGLVMVNFFDHTTKTPGRSHMVKNRCPLSPPPPIYSCQVC